jgi:hypothetical protein
MAVETLAEIAEDRFILGIGVSHRSRGRWLDRGPPGRGAGAAWTG